MSTQSVMDLLGEDLRTDPLGENMAGGLVAGYIPERVVLYQPQTQIGDGLAGPINQQLFQIQRDNRPIAADELGQQGPWNLDIGKYARHRAGRTFPLNEEYGPMSLDFANYERAPEMDTRAMSPISPGQLPPWHDGVPPVEVIGSPSTVFYTASPNVGWEGY